MYLQPRKNGSIFCRRHRIHWYISSLLSQFAALQLGHFLHIISVFLERSADRKITLIEDKWKSLTYHIECMESCRWGEGSVEKCLLKCENLSWDPNIPQTTVPWWYASVTPEIGDERAVVSRNQWSQKLTSQSICLKF